MDAGIILREAENVQIQSLGAFPTIFLVGMIFWTKNVIFICPLWGQFVLSTASISIMAHCPIFQFDFCLFTAHSAAFPVNPCQ